MSHMFILPKNILYWKTQAIERGYAIRQALYDTELFRAIKGSHIIIFYRSVV